MADLKIAMFSFGDINNYGDILFAHVFNMEMRSRLADVRIDMYSPTNADIGGVQYKAYAREKIEGKYDALILAGGEVVHFFDERTWGPVYAKIGAEVESALPSDTVWDWVDLEVPFKAWISVGVRPFEDRLDELKLRKAIEGLDLLSVRGVLSKKILEQGALNFYDPRITTTPDLGWLFPKYLEHGGSKGRLFTEHTHGEREYAIYQVNNITEEEAGIVADQLCDYQRRHGVRVFLLPVIHAWEDVRYLRMIAARSKGELEVLPNDLDILEMADLMVNARIVLSSSLHTAITALAAGVPAAIINKWQGTKLQDLFGHQFRLDFLEKDLSRTYEMLMKLENERKDTSVLKAYSKFMTLSLGRSFDDLASRIRTAVA